MDELIEGDATVIEVARRIKAPPDVVFSFLVDPERFIRWMGVKAELDARPGGRYRLTMANGDVASGVYQEVEPPHRLVFSWGWEGNPTLPQDSTTVEITLSEDGEATLLRLRHLDLPDEGTRRDHAKGWEMFTGQLAEVVEAS